MTALKESYGPLDALNPIEHFLSANEDMVFGVYEIEEGTREGTGNLEINQVHGVYLAYKNRFDNGDITGYKGTYITILDLKEFLQGKISVLHGSDKFLDRKDLTILSAGKYDLFLPENNTEKAVPFMITTKRDNGANDAGLRTSIVGRMANEDPIEHAEYEASEESPFLIHHPDRGYALMIPEVRKISPEEARSQLKKSIAKYLSEKYDPNNPEIRKLFEANFGIPYDELGEILADIGDEEIFFYNQEDITLQLKHNDPESELAKSIRYVIINGIAYSQHVYFDAVNNALEIRSIYLGSYGGMPEGYRLVGKGRLYLESKTQSPKAESLMSIQSINKKVLTHVRYLRDFAGQMVNGKL